MSKKCSLKGTRAQFGNNVSHSHRKTRRRFLPNIQSASFLSKYLGKISLKVTSRTIRTVDFKGGIDNFLLNSKAKNLSEEAQKLRRKIKKLASNENKPATKTAKK
ncbi:MAG: 50S ribosomal protein L28 [Rickettsiales bacterium]|nr:50S ribosomal protein L28 [Rickettsiales bacterium]